MALEGSTYPFALSLDFPDRPVNRLTSFFRLFTVIPIGIVAGLMVQSLPYLQSSINYNADEQQIDYAITRFIESGIDVSDMLVLAVVAALMIPVFMFLAGFFTNLFNPVVLMLVFRRKYPKWWFDYYVALIKFLTRVGTYFTLLTDVYPSTDEDQHVHIEIPYPDAERDLNQWLPLFKWFLAIPHYIILAFMAIAACFCDICIWFAILFTGKVPRGLFDFVAGTFRWSLRVAAYSYFQFTDEYPPFRLS